MSLLLVRAASKAENSDELHMARLLILLSTFDRRRRKSVEGITKLAKLDFLLRYPNCLERVLRIQEKNVRAAEIAEYERNSIETKMYRFRYGPWDDRYRRWISLLVAKGLTDTFVKGNTVHVRITDAGVKTAKVLGQTQEFSVVAMRSELITKAVGNLSAVALKNFIYDHFPEIIDMKWGENINL